jgi:hypothetical protein
MSLMVQPCITELVDTQKEVMMMRGGGGGGLNSVIRVISVGTHLLT